MELHKRPQPVLVTISLIFPKSLARTVLPEAMASKILNIGTRVLVKDEIDVKGTVEDFVKDKDGNLTGYRLNLDDGTYMIRAVD